MKKTMYAVIGVQFGSEAKGNVAGYLALQNKPDIVIHNWSPNAGHTTIFEGRKLVHCMLPMSVISPDLKYILIGPGAVIDTNKMREEIAAVRDLLDRNEVQLIIHPNASILHPVDTEAEKAFSRIGSTMKGSASAVIRRAHRDPDGMGTVAQTHRLYESLADALGYDRVSTDTHSYFESIEMAKCIAIEGCQGYSLSIYHGFYPYTTSRDTTTAQLLADCAIPFQMLTSGVWDFQVWGCVRSYPIRVANRFDTNGNQIGYSGPCYPDHKETTWEELGLDAEFTTVTKLKRRVFTFSMIQVMEAVHRNGVTHGAMNFCDYLSEDEFISYWRTLTDDCGMDVRLASFGPTTDDLYDVSGLTEQDMRNMWHDNFVR